MDFKTIIVLFFSIFPLVAFFFAAIYIIRFFLFTKKLEREFPEIWLEFDKPSLMRMSPKKSLAATKMLIALKNSDDKRIAHDARLLYLLNRGILYGFIIYIICLFLTVIV